VIPDDANEIVEEEGTADNESTDASVEPTKVNLDKLDNIEELNTDTVEP